MEPLTVKKRQETDRVVALAGNPNVGKSTVFNALTGLHQHTGNWPGKTVTQAQGYCKAGSTGFVLVDLPGCYSLLSHSAEEECAREFLCFGKADCTVVVCDAACLERNLNLALQALEITPNVVLCVNLLDEARKKGISVDLQKLHRLLGVPVVGTAARSGEGLEELLRAIRSVHPVKQTPVHYPPELERAIETILPYAEKLCGTQINPRWLALRLLEGCEETLADSLAANGISLHDPQLEDRLALAREDLALAGVSPQQVQEIIVSSLMRRAEELAAAVTKNTHGGYSPLDRKLDRLFTSRLTGIPILLLLLLFLFWLTASGANAPSAVLSQLFGGLGALLRRGLCALSLPSWCVSLLLDGVYKTLSWVVSVMLPPMAIFFPLFTLLEEFGYLPRAAFNLDRCYRRCGACGKQALTTAMGFGCNAAGVTGARIIDSPRERLLAILTNNFVPCNGRLPMLISLITMFFAASGSQGSLRCAVILLLVILLGVLLSMTMSKLLSHTVLRGQASSFALELPPYRRPQLGKVLVRSVLDRTLFVLGRAAAVAAPAGLLIWVLTHLSVSGQTLLSHCAAFLEPAGRFFGMDGVILLAFILGLPANEIVIPLIVMAYLSQGSLVEMTDLVALRTLLVQNGWTATTALCTMLFSLLHWPCSTTCMTIYKETKSLKWTALSVILPTGCGLVLCFFVRVLLSLT